MSGLARKAGAASIAAFLSRISGLVREQFIALVFGAGAATDAYNVAFRVPNLLRDLFAEGALNSAFVPTFTERLETAGKASAFALADRVVGALAVIVGALTLVAMVFTREAVAAIASGMLATPEQAARTILMTRILLPFLGAIALAALAMGALNALDHYFLPAAAPVMLNIGSVIFGGALAWVAPRFGYERIVGLAAGTMIGGLLQLAVQVPPLWREGWRPWPRVDFAEPGVRKILALMAPVTLANGTTQINVLVNTQIASHLAPGSISWLAYAFRLMQLPIGLFGVSLGSVSLPELKRLLTRGETAEAAAALEHALLLVFATTLPATAALIALARPIVALLYEYRRFTPAAADQTAAALVFYAIGLVGFSAVKVLAPAYYALEETGVPVRASVVAVVSNVIASFALMGPLAHRGLALATSLNGLLNMALLLGPLPARLPGYSNARVLSGAVRALLASTLMGFVCAGTASFLAGEAGSAGVLPRLWIVGGSASAGGLLLLIAYRALGVRVR